MTWCGHEAAQFKAIGSRLATLRAMRGYDPSEAATLACVSPRNWRRWEAGAPLLTRSFFESLLRLRLFRRLARDRIAIAFLMSVPRDFRSC